MSDTNRVSLRAVEELTYKTIPVTPAFEAIPIASLPNLAFTPSTVVSELLRDDRQISDLVLVGGSAGGDSNSELAFGIYDKFLEGAFFSTWQDRLKWENRTGVGISAVDADSYSVSDLGSSAVAGDLVFAEGFTAAANNGLKEVDAGTLATDVVIVGAGLTVEVPGPLAKLSVVGKAAGTGDIVATASPDSLTSTTLDFTTMDLEPGDWIVIQGFTTTVENNDYVRVVSVSANTLLVDRVPAGWAADPGTTDDVQLFTGERIRNGTTRRSYALEQAYNDHSPITYSYLRGMIVDGFTFTAAPQAIVTTGVTFLGADQFFSDANDPAQGTDGGTGRWLGATDVAAPRFQVMNSSSNVGRIARGGQVIVGKNFVTEASISIANNLREKPAVGVLGAADVGAGEFGVTGSLQAYFDDKSLAVDVVNNTESSFDVRFRDGTGRVQLFDVPRLKFSEGAPEVPGKNEDVTIPLQYQGLLDETLGYTLKLMRFHYAPV